MSLLSDTGYKVTVDILGTIGTRVVSRTAKRVIQSRIGRRVCRSGIGRSIFGTLGQMSTRATSRMNRVREYQLKRSGYSTPKPISPEPIPSTGRRLGVARQAPSGRRGPGPAHRHPSVTSFRQASTKERGPRRRRPTQDEIDETLRTITGNPYAGS